MAQDNSTTLVSSVKKFFSGTLLSRFTGLGREILMAAAFGTNPTVAAFWMAFRFSNLLRRLFGEGGLHVAFIPHFESLRKQDPKRAALFFHRLAMGLTVLLLLLTLMGEGIMGSFLVWGDLAKGNAEILRLTMILLPAITFICLYALNQSLLNCERSYFIPSVAPTVLNLIWMGAVIMLWNTPIEQAVEKLAMIIVFAFAAQWFFTVPKVYRYLSEGLGPRWWEQKEKMGKEIFSLLRPLLLGLVGVGATQVNNALDALFARAADAEGPAILWYALRIQQLPLALLGVGLTGALLPPISRAIEANEREKYLHLLDFALKRTFVFMIPLTMGIFVLGFAGINLVYGHGEFTSRSIEETTRCLWAYGAGLLPMTLVLIFASAFYARKNYRIPTFLAVLSVCLNIFLNALFVFVFHMGAISIAFATTLAACLNMALLAFFLAKKEGISFRSLTNSFVKITLTTLFASSITLVINGMFFGDHTLSWMLRHPLASFSHSLLTQLTLFLGCSVCYTVLIILFAYVFRVKEILEVLPKRTLVSRKDVL